MTRLTSAFDRYRKARVIILGFGFNAPGGAWKSIHQYFNAAKTRGEAVILIHGHSDNAMRQMTAAFFAGRRVLLNGLDCFHHRRMLFFCLFRSDAILYLHETKYIFDEFAGHHPWKFRFVRWLLPRHRICCVSKQQEAYLRATFGVTRTHVLYENIARSTPDEIDASAINIVMVGSIEPRKGASLFSAVADLAHERGLPWRFSWIGGAAATERLHLSTNVRWLGPRADVHPYLERATLFFLSSIDDPFPLSCLEALSVFIKVVVYRRTGLAEVLEDVPGCAVFESHDATAAFAAIERALAAPLDRERVEAINRDISSVDAFAARLHAVLDEHESRVDSATGPAS